MLIGNENTITLSTWCSKCRYFCSRGEVKERYGFRLPKTDVNHVPIIGKCECSGGTIANFLIPASAGCQNFKLDPGGKGYRTYAILNTDTFQLIFISPNLNETKQTLAKNTAWNPMFHLKLVELKDVTS